ncbi:DNA-deoxyinosine glycosylase [Vitreoscilla sp. C1]|uniref:DNA-deoxyinosine glycosylase n=1 Tax=Vitreoscilla sp. (strain C1) TaxID=96942 RepID=UPI001F0201AB|nr:DNA-deoxyinosine glycosylase [Vitreoscilla sp. C1]
MATNHRLMGDDTWKQSFKPIVGTEPKVMILGSLPGDASLQKQQYYAHPRNQFWRLLGDCCGVDLQSFEYADKIDYLQRMPLILWDVIDKAKRQGSLDSAIHQAHTHDLPALLLQYPSIEQVWFNGQQAAKLGQRQLLNAAMVQVVLPSSSPAYTVPYAHKLSHWQQAWQQLFVPD